MELKDIVSVAGMGGLHQVVGQRSNGLILESLDASKKRFPTSTNTKVSILDDIALYTINGEIPFREVVKSLFEKEKEGLTVPDKKADNAEYVVFMEKLLPDYDKDRVYVSDIKKLATWYLILRDNTDLSTLLVESAKEDETSTEETTIEGETKPAKKVKSEKAKTTVKSTTVKANTKTAGGAKKVSAPRKTGGG